MNLKKNDEIKQVSAWFSSEEGRRQTEAALKRAKDREISFRKDSQVDIKKLHEPFTI